MSHDSIRKTKEQFVAESISIHGNKFNYDNVVYKNIKTKVELICPTHGPFLVSPNSHLTRKVGCQSCSGRKRRTTQSFIHESKQIYGDRFDYSLVEYKNTETPVIIICSKHGKFTTIPKKHLYTNQSCKRCGIEQSALQRRYDVDWFVAKARQVHGDTYDYSNTVYTTSSNKVIINCHKHGQFSQLPTNHLNSKQGCPSCWDERRPSGVGGYSATFFENYPERHDDPATLYVVQIQCETDNFIKVGITTRSVDDRFAISGMASIDRITLREINTTLYQAHLLEVEILAKLKQHQYWPNYFLKRCTECLHNNHEVITSIVNILQHYHTKS